jgi:glycosyltransferase involved in cell wall biosynthesis
VGRFEPQKDFETLFAVVREVASHKPHVRFVVAGSGKREAEYRTLAEKTGAARNVLFTGWVDYFDLPKYYAGADAFLLCSVHETNPRVVIFSRLAQKAAVATDVSGVRDFIEDGVSGFVRPLKDAPGLAQALMSILDDPERAAAMGRAGFETAQRILDRGHILAQMESMYRGVFEERFAKGR